LTVFFVFFSAFVSPRLSILSFREYLSQDRRDQPFGDERFLYLSPQMKFAEVGCCACGPLLAVRMAVSVELAHARGFDFWTRAVTSRPSEVETHLYRVKVQQSEGRVAGLGGAEQAQTRKSEEHEPYSFSRTMSA